MDGGGSSVDRISERTEDNLLALVGYAEIEKASKVSRSTIERAWRGPWDDGEPQFRKPGKIGSRSLWTAGDVNDWLLARARWQTGVITNLARVSVDDLEPEQLEDQALDLAAQALSKRTGISVDPQDVSLHLMQRLTGDDFIALQTQEHSGRAAYLAQLPVDQAVVVAATLLPQLRPALMAAASPRARGHERPEPAGNGLQVHQ